jgi:hypothetical protein
MIESPIYVRCPTCGAAPMQPCRSLITNTPIFEFHDTRTP